MKKSTQRRKVAKTQRKTAFKKCLFRPALTLRLCVKAFARLMINLLQIQNDIFGLLMSAPQLATVNIVLERKFIMQSEL